MLANKTRERDSITFQGLCFCDYWRTANSVINKGKSLICPLFSSSEGLPCVHLIRQRCLLKFFLRTLTLMDQVSHQSTFSLRTNMKLGLI